MKTEDSRFSTPDIRLLIAAFFLLLQGLFLLTVGQTAPSGLDRDRGRTILSTIKDDLKKNYYDPTFHGMDLDQRFRVAEEKIKRSPIFGPDLRDYRPGPDRARR